MKVSEVEVKNVADYLRIDDYEEQEEELKAILEGAKSYVKSYTGLTEEEIDKHEDITIAVYVLCQSMYDDRNYHLSSQQSTVNKVVSTILGMHCVNLL